MRKCFRSHPFCLRPASALVFALLLACSLAPAAFARQEQQQRRRRPPVVVSVETVRLAPPSPRSVLGFTPGDDRKVADWTEITDYFERLDRASARVKVEPVGATTLGRTLFAAFISSPENIRQLAKYKDIQRRLADPRLVSSEAERERLLREGRTVVAISCSIHSTEIVGSQMAMQLAYELAAGGDEETREILSNTILILIPSANPDGNDIVADWYRKSLGKPWEGSEPPELYHHYAGHDNNRDWFMLNLAETRAITRLFWKEWFPQIVYDVHQQGANGSRFFIPPFYDPPNPHIAPLLLREVGLVGHRVAADLQARGFRGVITNAMYDTWWHGGFRTAPYFHNSVGILSEAASARLMTPVNIKREELERARARGMPNGALTPMTNFPDPWPGGPWRPADIRDMELVAARAVLSMAATQRERYLRNFYELGRRALDWPPKDENERPAHFREDAPVAYVLPAGQGRDETVAKFIGTLVEQGVEVHRLERELHAVLDRPIHAAPHQGTNGAAHESKPQDVPLGSYIVFLAQPYRANVQALFERQRYPERRTPTGEAERPYDVAGWTLPMQMGVETARAFRIVEPPAERRLKLVEGVSEMRKDLGLSPDLREFAPPPDFIRKGRDIKRVSPIRSPVAGHVRVALYKSWTGSMDEGWTRYVFDNFNVPYKSLRDEEVRAGNLRAKYDVIVLPSMREREIVEGRAKNSAPPELTGGMGAAGVAALRRFVEDGGTLVAWDASTDFVIKHFELPLRNALEGLRSSDFYCPGSILRVEVNTAHPLARTMPRLADVYFVNSVAFDVKDAGRVEVVARYAERKEDVLRSGWLLGPQHLAGKPAVVQLAHGKGRLRLIGFRPQHRAQTWGTFPFVFNALGQ